MSHCPKCGRQVPANTKFCPGCGHAISAPASGTATATSGSGLPIPFLRNLSRWDAWALIGGLLGAGAWRFWSTRDKAEPPDDFTHWYVIGFTAMVIFLRKPIDKLLTPLQVIKQHLPRLVLIGVALALPYYLAHYFYYSKGIREYPLMHKTVIWGTILPYILLRIPQNWQGAARSGLAQATQARFWLGFAVIALAVVFGDACLALAHDFLSDTSRLRDGLRTDAWGVTIAGTASTGINVLVNGSLVFQRPPKPGKDGEEQASYTMDVRTEDERTSIAADGEDRMWVYAKIMCSKASVNAQGLTSAISFTFGGSKYAEWMSIKSTQSHSGYKAVLIACTPPTPETEIEDGASVELTVEGQTADGEPMRGTVTLQLDPPLRVNITVLA